MNDKQIWYTAMWLQIGITLLGFLALLMSGAVTAREAILVWNLLVGTFMAGNSSGKAERSA